MKLLEHIEESHKGNISAFSNSIDVMPYQTYRWMARGCIFLNGTIYCPITKHKEKSNERTTTT